MLARALDAAVFTEHSPARVPWDELAAASIVAMHWHRTPAFESFLRTRGFETVVLVRHPLDVLISILQFSQHEPATARWLDGEGGDESLLRGADPASPEFLQYALGPRAALLLNVSAEWLPCARHVVRYERLVAAPEKELEAALECLGRTAVSGLAEAVGENTFERIRPFSPYHFWRGEPGLWRRLVVPAHRKAIYERYRDLFDLLRYERPDESPLTSDQARYNWDALRGAGRG